MMLDVDSATPYLLRRGLVDVDAILAGDLTIRGAARRNRNLLVRGAGGAGYLLKQPDDPALGGAATLRAEAAFYDACRRGAVPPEVARLAPRLADFDPDRVVLALDLIPDAITYWNLDWTGATPGLAAEAGRALGHALGTIHRGLRLPVADTALADLPRSAPWALRVHRPGPEVLGTLSAANFRALRILQDQPGLAARLDDLYRSWRVESVIHGDVKADNLLYRPASTGPARAWLVDWELVQLGDPAWDLAGALHDLLHNWVASIPPSPGVAPEALADRALHPLPILQSSARSLWRAYRAAAEIPPAEADAFLLRSVAYSAARLIQSAYELAFEAHQLPAPAVLLLQLGANLVADPASGQVHLYGIPRGLA